MKNLDKPIEELNIKSSIIQKLKSNNIILIEDLWHMKRKDLKNLNFNDTEINQIIIQLQLKGLDLNKKVY